MTSYGDPKVVDLVDVSGSGDVDMSVVRVTEGDSNRLIDGLSGRKLKVNTCVHVHTCIIVLH